MKVKSKKYDKLVEMWKNNKIDKKQLEKGFDVINKKNGIKNKLVVTGWIKGGKIIEYRRVV